MAEACPSVQGDRQCALLSGHRGLHESRYRSRQWANEDDPRCMTYRHDGRASVSLCGREIKDEGMCARHLAAKRRRDANDRARLAENERVRRQREESKALAAALTERLGIEVVAQFSNDDLVIRADTARAFLGRPAQGGESRG